MLKEFSICINIGAKNDEIMISRILKENRINMLRSVHLINNYKLQLNFVKFESDNYLNDLMNAPTYHKRVIQISKRKHHDVYEHIKKIMEDEKFPITAKKYVKHKTWKMLAIIDMPTKWLVFMV